MKIKSFEFVAATALGALTLLLASTPGSAQVIPPDRTINWQRSIIGVPLGLSPTYTNDVPYRTTIWTNAVTAGCDPTASHDCSAILNRLLAQCPSNGVVYLPPGQFLITNTVTMANSGVSLRGAGLGQTTIIDGASNVLVALFQIVGNQLLESYTNISLLSGYTKGSTNLTLSTTSFTYNSGTAIYYSPLYVGEMINILQNDDSNFVVYLNRTPYWGAPSPYTNNLQQATMVTSVNANNNTITVWPPLLWNFTNTFNPAIEYYHSPTVYACSIEDMTITHVNPSTGFVGQAGTSVTVDQAWGCWLRNIDTGRTSRYHFYFSDTVQCTVRDCYLHEASTYGPSEGVGLMFYHRCCSALVENNTFYRCFPAIEVDGGSSGNVFDYNFSYEILTAPATNMASQLDFCDFDCNHGAHNIMNLWEGNEAGGFKSDGFFGSCSHQTLFRNYFSGTHPLTAQFLMAVDLTVWAYYFNLVGNVLGSPPYTNLNGTVEWVPGRTLFDDPTNLYSFNVTTVLRYGFPALGNTYYQGCPAGGVYGVYDPLPSTWSTNDGGWRDTKVEATVFLADNFDYYNNTTVSPVTNLPASLYYSNTPSWWPATTPWPPIGPDCSNTMAAQIPAQARLWATGIAPPVIGPIIPLTPAQMQAVLQTQAAAQAQATSHQIASPPCFQVSSSSTELPYCPANDSSVVEWLRADGGLDFVGTNVVNWIADVGVNATQNNANSAPVELMNGHNGLPAIGFNGTSSFLHTAPFPTPLHQPFTIFLVYNWQASSTGPSFVYDGIDNNRAALLNNNGYSAPNAVCVYYGSGGGTSTGLTTNANWNIAEFLVNGSASAVSVNGSTLNPIPNVQGTNGLNGLTLGARFDGGENASVQIGEFIIVQGTAASSQGSILSYLRHRWSTY